MLSVPPRYPALLGAAAAMNPTRGPLFGLIILAGFSAPLFAVEPRRFNFENDIVPLLSRHGCNSSGCHGKAEGQNGFKLSVFGFDPAADYAALVKEGRGRRVQLSAPEQSLLLTKMSALSTCRAS